VSPAIEGGAGPEPGGFYVAAENGDGRFVGTHFSRPEAGDGLLPLPTELLQFVGLVL
jgi:hypothetical protein